MPHVGLTEWKTDGIYWGVSPMGEGHGFDDDWHVCRDGVKVGTIVPTWPVSKCVSPHTATFRNRVVGTKFVGFWDAYNAIRKVSLAINPNVHG